MRNQRTIRMMPEMREKSEVVIDAINELVRYTRERMTIDEADDWFDVIRPLYDAMNSLKEQVMLTDSDFVSSHIYPGLPYRLNDEV